MSGCPNQKERIMGYRSQVTIEIQGKKDSVHLLLKTYAMGETPEQIESANHILGPSIRYPNQADAHPCYDLLHHEWVVNQTEPYLALIFSFDDVKWYTESQQAFERLLDVADNLRAADNNIEIAIFFNRVGEDMADVESDNYFDYEAFDQYTRINTSIDVGLSYGDNIDADHFIKTLEPSRTKRAEDEANWNDLMMQIEKEKVAA